MTTELPDTHSSMPAPEPLALKSNEGLGLVPERDGFTPAELRLPYTLWTALAKERRVHLSPGMRKWLADWTIWDLACSTMGDDERPLVRYGHYLGWWDRWHTERRVGKCLGANVGAKRAPEAVKLSEGLGFTRDEATTPKEPQCLECSDLSQRPRLALSLCRLPWSLTW